MPSRSLQHWRNDRQQRLTEVDLHCAALALLTPPNVLLAEESLRGYVLLLSGHFQGFCRDLYTECAQTLLANVPTVLHATGQAQFFAELKLNSHNPTIETIRKYFERFGFTLDISADPANGLRMTHLGHLNKWRNAVAHQIPTTPAGIPPLTLAEAQGWRSSCDGLATWLDTFMYNELQRILATAPW